MVRNRKRKLVQNVRQDNRKRAHELLPDDIDVVWVVNPGSADGVRAVEAFLSAFGEGDFVVGSLAEVVDHLSTADNDHPLIRCSDLESTTRVLR